MRFFVRFSLLVFFVVFAQLAIGQANTQYFSASVPVTSQSTAERTKAARQGLAQVLVRMSGSDAVISDGVIRQKVNDALSIVEQFQYESLDSEDLKAEGYSDMLSLTFSSALVEKILAEAQQPYWPVNRPTTLIWLVQDTAEGNRQLHNQQSDLWFIESLADAAELRGLPIIYPLLDLDDQLALSADDVWQVNEQAIVEASARYDADVILVGRFSQTSRGELWTMWQFFHAGTTQSYDSRYVLAEEGPQVAPVGAAGLDPLASFLAQRYAISPQLEAGGILVMQVSGVKSYGSYRQSLDYLQGLAAVSDVQLAAVRQDSMLLFLASEASIEKLLGVLALDARLQPLSAATPGLPVWQQAPRGTMENPLHFEWSR